MTPSNEKAAGGGAVELPLMRQAFRTTEVHGDPDQSKQRFRMVFQFPDLETLHSAEDEWMALNGSGSAPSSSGNALSSGNAGEVIETIPTAADGRALAGFWLAPMEPDTAMIRAGYYWEADERVREFWNALRDHWLARHPDPSRTDAESALKLQADRIAELEKDAARYRWLRDRSVPPHNFYISVPVEFEGVRYTPAEVDAGIDTAIRKTA